MKRYTIGALFTPDFKQVLLIQKTKPEWQKGKLNLPGGSIEQGELPEECVAREFLEETALNIYPLSWKHIGRIDNPDNYQVELLTAVYDGDTQDAKQMTEEGVGWFFVNDLPDHVISNLRWLIPFAINFWNQGNADNLKFGNFEYTFQPVNQ